VKIETPNIPKPGIYFDIPFAEYQTWEALNSSSLDRRSGHHTAARMRRELRKESSAFDLGRMAHTAILEPDKFPLEYGVMIETNGRLKVAKEEKAALIALGKQPCSQIDWAVVCKMRDSVARSDLATSLLRDCRREVSIAWVDPGTAIMCKARLDGIDIDRNRIVDLKTSLDACPESFAKSMLNYGYHRQAWWYCRGWTILSNQPRPDYVWVVVEKLSPFGVAVYSPLPHVMEVGGAEAVGALREFRDRDEAVGAYGEEMHTIGLPAWKIKQIEAGQQEHTGSALTVSGERVEGY